MKLLRLGLVVAASVFSLSSVAVAREHTRVLLYGDAGRGSSTQSQVADGMAAVDGRTPFDFALSLGDNQYIGVGSEVMKKIFEEPYKDLIARGLVFFQTLGNHDMEFGRHQAQLKYSREKDVLKRGVGGWALPADDYEVVHGDTRWIVTNTSAANLDVVLPPSRMLWLEEKICGARERWVFLSMHYPMWSSNSHGDNKELQRRLSPLLTKCPVDGLLAGHDHGGEVIRTPFNTRQFVLGNAANANMPGGKTSGVSEWRYGSPGFGELELTDDRATFTFYNRNGEERKKVEWSPAPRKRIRH